MVLQFGRAMLAPTACIIPYYNIAFCRKIQGQIPDPGIVVVYYNRLCALLPKKFFYFCTNASCIISNNMINSNLRLYLLYCKVE